MNETIEIVELAGQKIVGTEVRTSNADEQNEATAKIPAHWAEFSRQNPGAASAVALYTNYESDFRGEYSHVIGWRVDSQNSNLLNLGDNSKVFVVPAGKFLKFAGHGDFPGVVFQQWQRVWDYFSAENAPYQRNYQADLEIPNASGVEIFIGIY